LQGFGQVEIDNLIPSPPWLSIIRSYHERNVPMKRLGRFYHNLIDGAGLDHQ